MLIDLQVHSTYSDGYLSPTALAQDLARQGIKVAALTDHNTVAGQDEFRVACRKNKIKSVTGVEIYARFLKRRVNVLWYNFDAKSPDLHDLLRATQIRRRNQVRKLLKRLQSLGFKIEVNKILDKYTHYVPSNHVLDDIYSVPANRKKIQSELKNKTPREEDILDRYFYNMEIGKLENSYVSLERLAQLKKKIGGKLIICHPGKHGRFEKAYLKKLKKIGVDGLEILSPHHSVRGVMYFQQMAEELDLITTAGSDFHRYEDGRGLLQSSWQWFRADDSNLRNIKDIIS